MVWFTLADALAAASRTQTAGQPPDQNCWKAAHSVGDLLKDQAVAGEQGSAGV
jgi:hypothetical protein